MPISLQQLKDAGNTPSDREWGTPSLTQTYLRDTPHARIENIRHAFACATLDGLPCNCGVANVQVLREKKPVGNQRFIKFLDEASQPGRRIGVALDGHSEYWAIGDTVFRAAIGAPIDGDGHPCGKKWMCTIQHWDRYRDAFEPVKT